MAEPPSTTAPSPEVMELGKAQYAMCAACHGPNGEGMPNVGPPLAQSEWVTGPWENLVRIQFRGLTGPIVINGEEMTFPAPMAPMGAALPDESVAAILTYIRNSFGNTAPPVTPEQVAQFAHEKGQPALTMADLIDPTTQPQSTTTDSPAADSPSPSDASSSTSQSVPAPTSSLPAPGLGLPLWGLILTLLITALTIYGMIRAKKG